MGVRSPVALMGPDMSKRKGRAGGSTENERQVWHVQRKVAKGGLGRENDFYKLPHQRYMQSAG